MNKYLKYGLIALSMSLLTYLIFAFLYHKSKLKDIEFQKQTAVLEAQIVAQTNAANLIANQVTQLQQQLVSELAKNDSLKKQVADLQTNTADADADLAKQNQSSAPVDCTPWIEKYNADISAKDKEISGLQELTQSQANTLSDYQKEIDLLNQELTSKQTVIDEQGQELTGYKAEVENLNKQVRYALWKGRLQGAAAGFIGGLFLGKFW